MGNGWCGSPLRTKQGTCGSVAYHTPFEYTQSFAANECHAHQLDETSLCHIHLVGVVAHTPFNTCMAMDKPCYI
jgi:hypothetical protein